MCCKEPLGFSGGSAGKERGSLSSGRAYSHSPSPRVPLSLQGRGVQQGPLPTAGCSVP